MNYLLIFLLLFILIIGIYGCKTFHVPTYKGAITDHFDGKKFHNIGGNKMGSFKELMKFQWKNKKKKWNYISTTHNHEIFDRVSEGIRYKQINHASILIQHDNVNILTDPVYSKRASPFSWMGPKRFRPPSITIDQLPPIDLIVISHDHYDHLDVKTLKKLSDQHDPTILVGLGLKRFLEKFHIKNVVEMDWNESFTVQSVDITFLPAKHWSNRFASPYKTLWGSYLFQSPYKTIYFAGDTGFDSHFQTIKDTFGHIDLALIPIGAYVPRSFMKHVHMPPEDAFKAHKVLQPTESLAIHWGTFQLTYEGMFDPVEELHTLCSKDSIDNFFTDKNHNQYYFQE